MTEHLDTHRFTTRTHDVVALDGFVNAGHLVEVQLAGQHHDVGKAGVESQGLGVRDIQLGGQMHLHPNLAGIVHGRHVAGDDGRETGLLGSIDDAVQQVYVLVVNHGVDREIALDVVLVADAHNLVQVVDGKVVRRAGAHVEPLDTEVNRVGPSLYGGSQRVVRTHGCHNFKIASLHHKSLLFPGDYLFYFVQFVQRLDRREVIDVGPQNLVANL